MNQLLGTDAASRLLSEARGAQQSALASAAGEGATGQRLLSSLLKTQGATISDLLSKKQQFEAKVPSLISQRMQDLADAELQNYYKSQALGLQQNRFSLDVAKEARLSAKDAAAESRQGKLSETKLAEYRKKAAEDAIALANGQSTNVYEIINRKTGERRLKGQTSTKSPITNYQQAYKIMYSKYGDILTTREILDKLNSVPIWNTPGQSGRPYIDILFRNLIKDKTDIPDALVERAAFDPNAAEEVSRRYNEFRLAYGG